MFVADHPDRATTGWVGNEGWGDPDGPTPRRNSRGEASFPIRLSRREERSMSSAASRGSLSSEQLREAIATLSSPDRVESPFGGLDFFDGVPTPDTVTTIYDALDLMRGIEMFLNSVPGASLVAMRRGLRSIGITSPHVIAYSDPRANSGSLFLTPNTRRRTARRCSTCARGGRR
jgi:hypothetical protein